MSKRTSDLSITLAPVLSLGFIMQTALAYASDPVRWLEGSVSDGGNALDHDPRIGSTIVSGIPQLADIESRDGILVIALGTCSSCSKYSIDPQAISFGGKVLFLAQVDSPEKLPKPFRQIPANQGIIFDPDATTLTKRLNAIWSGRWYLLDSSGVLLDFQQTPDRPMTFLQREIL